MALPLLDFVNANSKTQIKQKSDSLVSFYEHCPVDDLPVLKQCHLYCLYSLVELRNLVHSHAYLR